MAIPPTASSFPDAMDPTDYLDFQVDLGETLLQAGELIESYSLTLLPESVAAGLTISSETGRQDQLVGGTSIHFWLYVDAGMRSDPIFSGSGSTLGIEVTVVTNSIPFRRLERTVTITVAQQ